MIKKIPLGRKTNKFALVDEDDFLKVAHLNWHESICGAAQRRPYRGKQRKKGCIFMHYVLLNLTGRKGVRVKHLNGNRLDCRRKNMVLEKH